MPSFQRRNYKKSKNKVSAENENQLLRENKTDGKISDEKQIPQEEKIDLNVCYKIYVVSYKMSMRY